MAWTYCTSAAALARAGKNHPAVSTTGLSGALLEDFSNEVEDAINSATDYNWSGALAATSPYIALLQQTAAAGIALSIVNYDMSAYTGLAEAQTLLNVNRDIYDRNIKVLKDKNASFHPS